MSQICGGGGRFLVEGRLEGRSAPFNLFLPPERREEQDAVGFRAQRQRRGSRDDAGGEGRGGLQQLGCRDQVPLGCRDRAVGAAGRALAARRWQGRGRVVQVRRPYH